MRCFVFLQPFICPVLQSYEIGSISTYTIVESLCRSGGAGTLRQRLGVILIDMCGTRLLNSSVINCVGAAFIIQIIC